MEQLETPFFRKEDRDAALVLWNTNTAARNALTPGYYAGVLAGLAEAGERPEIASVILAGEGGFFCAGGDLKMLKERQALPLAKRREKIDQLHDIIRAIRACPKPVIAAIEGGAAGAGFSIAMACDMVVSARSAKFTLAYVKAGLVPDGGATWSLAQALPRATLSRMAMLGQPISAERLFDLGSISALCAPDMALNTALELAEQVASGPEQAISQIKLLLESAQVNALEQQLDAECEAMAKALGSQEAQEGMKAFLEKRQPKFRT